MRMPIKNARNLTQQHSEIRNLADFSQAVSLKDEPFDLILYNAGMDPYEGCAIGGLDGISDGTLASRDSMVFAWAQERQIPVVFVLAGGYVSDGLPQSLLVNLHRMTIRAALVTAAVSGLG